MEISIITSLYNSDQHISKFYKRVLRVAKFLDKKRYNFEIIFIANFPTANEKKYLEKFKETIKNCMIIEVERETLYASWNRGIKAATGKAICFWNVDDIRFGKALIEGYKKIKNGADIVYFPFFSFIARWGRRYLKYLPIFRAEIIIVPKFSITRNEEGMIGGPFFMFAKKIVYHVGYFDEQFKVVGDYDWFIKSGKASAKFSRSLLLAGVYIKQGNNTLSGGYNNHTHKAENQVVYSRYNLVSKIKKLSSEENEILKKYKV